MRVSNRKVAREALTVAQAGRVWSREMDRNQSADAVLSAREMAEERRTRLLQLSCGSRQYRQSPEFSP